MGALDPFDRRRLRKSDMALLAVEKRISWDEARRLLFAKWLVANAKIGEYEGDDTLVRPRREVSQ